MYSVKLPVFIAMNIIFLLALLSLWCYMTIYLVTPINTVKRSIEAVTAGNLAIHHSTVNANGNGGNGIHVTGKLTIDQKSTVTVQENDCSISSKWTIPGALMIAGQSKISDSTVTIQNNGGSGIYQKAGSLTVEDDAKLTIVKNTAEMNAVEVQQLDLTSYMKRMEKSRGAY